MPETKKQRAPVVRTQRRRATKQQTATRKPSAARSDRDAAVQRTADLSEDVLKSLDDGARAAIDAVRKFADTVDRVLPPRGEGPSKREEITDSALEMAQRLVHTQYEFLSKVVDSAGKSLSKSSDAK